MIRRLRLFLFIFALTLTGLALSPKVRAAECTEGEYGWIDFGSCCPYVNGVQLLRGQCVDGTWEIVPGYPGYKCLADPC
jgi:hypothetical protein